MFSLFRPRCQRANFFKTGINTMCKSYLVKHNLFKTRQNRLEVKMGKAQGKKMNLCTVFSLFYLLKKIVLFLFSDSLCIPDTKKGLNMVIPNLTIHIVVRFYFSIHFLCSLCSINAFPIVNAT